MPRTPRALVPQDDLTTTLELLPLADLRPHPRNDGQHPPEEIAHLKQSLTEHGVYRNVVVAKDGTILAGHGVVEAAQALGHTHIAGKRLPYDPDDPQALKVLVGDNHIARLRLQDDAVLTDLLLDLRQHDLSLLLGTGFDEAALQALITATQEGAAVVAPDAFPAYDETIPTEHTCPRCGYEWSGGNGA
jgi:ParB-like chromosome segregation protein Spo0J